MNKNIFAVLALSILINNAPASAAETQKLPAPLINGGKPLMETLAARRTEREFSPREIDAQTLSEILWSAWGISHGDKRTVPTSQNKQNLKVYVAKADGTWLYNAKDNRLEQISPQDLRPLLAKQDFVKTAPLTLIFAGSDSKNTPMHAGSAYQNVGLYCASKGLSNVVRGYLDREAVEQALKLPPEEKVVITQTIGWPK
jgi:nitroreductase